MLKPKLHITTHSEADIPPGIEDYLWELFKPRISELIKLEGKNFVEPVEEYMPMLWFCKKYDFSKETFRRIKNSSQVHSYRKFKCKLYNVEQFKKAYQEYVPDKPFIKNSFLKVV
jgi:hypothetical protein